MDPFASFNQKYGGTQGTYNAGQFNTSGGGSSTGGMTIDTFLNRLANTESGGNYKALGPVIKTGMYKGDQAYGKYQIMGFNIPSWTKKYLGRTMNPTQFLNDPEAQDELMRKRAQELYNEWGTWEDVASIHFTGQPFSNGKDRKDELGTSGQE